MVQKIDEVVYASKALKNWAKQLRGGVDAFGLRRQPEALQQIPKAGGGA